MSNGEKDMNIRKWFGFHGKYDLELAINSYVDGLLELYAKAIMKYFNVFDAEDYRAILILNPAPLTKDQVLFLNWLKQKGFPYLVQLASENLPNDEQFISKIEYETYIIGEEMDFEYPEDVRSSLIGIVNDLPEYINIDREVIRGG